MALARTLAVTLTGLSGHLVEVEAHAVQGLPGFTLVGLPDAAVRESRERVRAALSTCGLTWGEQRLTVNLFPADLRKSGTGLDLAMALAVLGARGRLPGAAAQRLARTVYIGELGLDGSVHPVRGVLPAVHAAVEAGVKQIVVSAGAATEARLVPGAQVEAVRHVGELVELYGGRLGQAAARIVREAGPGPQRPPRPQEEAVPTGGPDLADVVGQQEARHALEVAAAGGHHLLMLGPPGAGKTMLAERLPSILPPLEPEDAVTVTSIHSVAGTFSPEAGLISRRPLRSPHHTATRAAVIGGGSGVPRPGDVSLAHRGVLFLDEAPEFSAGVLDCLRQPVESGSVTIDRVGGRATFPAAFQLVLAANPCPCGRALGRGLECTCTSLQRRRYLSRLSGPLLDRVDIQVEVAAVAAADLAAPGQGPTSAEVAQRVARARHRTRARLAGTPWRLNAQVPGSYLRGPAGGLPAELCTRLMAAMERGDLSLRGVDRVLRLTWTLADLEGAGTPSLAHLGAALALRTRGARP
ncbi:YifB family Mg chelatase-like AAA ATPase [Actinomyces slackii]|uniref:Competence protein ComM n=1 Tax=Actinomyces slackii TaxID=52774 RepID=A0A3S4WIA8_9ACTO|nr:YifB family Mg chelatase-like AAA ATPase [Actinomyces slackii]VEG75606.1 Competence protein ComM [Actinomyces slackii]